MGQNGCRFRALQIFAERILQFPRACRAGGGQIGVVARHQILRQGGELVGCHVPVELPRQRGEIEISHVYVGEIQRREIQGREVKSFQRGIAERKLRRIEQGGEGRFQRARVNGKGVCQRVLVHREQVFQREAVFLLLAEGRAGEHVHRGLGELLFHDLALGRLIHHMARERGGVIDSGGEHGGCDALCGLHHAHDCELLSLRHKLAQEGFVARMVGQHAELLVIGIVVRSVHKAVGDADHIVVGKTGDVLRHIHILLRGKLLHHVVELLAVAQAERVEHQVAHVSAGGQHQHAFVVSFRPAPGFHLILVFIKRRVLRHFMERVGAHHGGHHAVAGGSRADSQRGEGLIRVHLPVIAVLPQVNLRGDAVGIGDRLQIGFDSAAARLKVFLERGQVI